MPPCRARNRRRGDQPRWRRHGKRPAGCRCSRCATLRNAESGKYRRSGRVRARCRAGESGRLASPRSSRIMPPAPAAVSISAITTWSSHSSSSVAARNALRLRSARLCLRMSLRISDVASCFQSFPLAGGRTGDSIEDPLSQRGLLEPGATPEPLETAVIEEHRLDNPAAALKRLLPRSRTPGEPPLYRGSPGDGGVAAAVHQPGGQARGSVHRPQGCASH